MKENPEATILLHLVIDEDRGAAGEDAIEGRALLEGLLIDRNPIQTTEKLEIRPSENLLVPMAWNKTPQNSFVQLPPPDC